MNKNVSHYIAHPSFQLCLLSVCLFGYFCSYFMVYEVERYQAAVHFLAHSPSFPCHLATSNLFPLRFVFVTDTAGECCGRTSGLNSTESWRKSVCQDEK